MTLFLISLVAGFLTVLAPCILPLLPVVVGGSISDGKINKKKAFTVIVSLGVSIIVFTYVLKVSTLFIDIPESFWKYFSGGIILLFGIITVFPKLWEQFDFVAKLSQKSNLALGAGFQKKSFLGDVIMGASLGPVFSTCSPTYFLVLASVLPQSFLRGSVYLLAYVFGLSVALLLVALLGQRIVSKLGIASNPNGAFKKILGIIFIVVGLAVMSGGDKIFQTALLNAGVFDVTKIEQSLLQKNSNSAEKAPTGETSFNSTDSGITENASTPNSKVDYLSLSAKQKKYKLAPEIKNPSGFVNTGGVPINLAQYKGKKVVLLDIWTYSCINCQRTTPYLNAWYTKYEDKGLVIIGLHTPEFGFEKVLKNVEDAVIREKIKYPVVLDNEYATWNAFGNQFWPRKYLIDIDGYIVYDHIGEGFYDETERAIQAALGERDSRLQMGTEIPSDISKPEGVVTPDNAKLGSHETYFGSARNEYLANGKKFTSGIQALQVPDTLKSNVLYLSGIWNFVDESAEASSGAEIVYRYTAKNVYLVASSDQGSIIEVYRDGKLVSSEAGEDVDKNTGTISVGQNRLYKLIEDSDYGTYILKIKIKSGTLKAFAFTFG